MVGKIPPDIGQLILRSLSGISFSINPLQTETSFISNNVTLNRSEITSKHQQSDCSH
jgi:hypothetical protein